ncbi:MAG TPA: response regulator transcription factor [Gaiellaceae bacterium]|nr:response regulator transcription factor [Gaiellaceae bacterium]
MAYVDPTPLRVVVADDHAPTREFLCDDLAASGIEVVARASNGREAVTAAVRSEPDLCLLDLQMPGLTGIGAAVEIKARLEAVKVVIITAEPEGDTLFEAIRAGAEGYLSKRIDGRRLPIVLRAVAAGDTAYPRRELQQALNRFRAAA